MFQSRKHLLRWLWLLSVLFLGYLLGSKWGGSGPSGGSGGPGAAVLPAGSPNIPSGMYGSSAPRTQVTPGPRSAEQNLPSSAGLLARSGATPSRKPEAAMGEGTLTSRCESSSPYTLSRLEKAEDPDCREMLRPNKESNEFSSQYNQDAWLFHNFFRCMPGPGTYADIGAGQHPRKLSNTWFLDRCLGWKGVCAEADHAAAEALRHNRSCTVVESAVSTFPGRGTVKSGPGGAILTHVRSLESLEKEAKEKGKGVEEVAEEGSVPLIGLEDVLVAADWEPSEATGRVLVDYLNVAVEDHEFEVLFGTPWDLLEIRFITVDNVKNTLDVRELLTDQSYVLAQSVGMDDFYARLPLDKDLWRPVNLNWNRHAHAGIRKKYHSVTSYLKNALYKGWDEYVKFVNKHLTVPTE
jgi:hypothetical protein